MNLHNFPTKNRLAKPLKWEKSEPRVPDSVVKCRYCMEACFKNGKEKNKQQKYKCKNCNKSQQKKYRYNAYNVNLNQNIIALTKEGMGIRGSARLLNISPTTLISIIKKIASKIEEPILFKGKTYEVDELRTFVKKKENWFG